MPVITLYSTIIIVIVFPKKVNKQAHQKLGIFNWSRDHSRSKKVLKQAGVLDEIKNHSKSISIPTVHFLFGVECTVEIQHF